MNVPPYDPDGPTPIYRTLAEHLAARLEAGEWRRNERLPAETELLTEYGVALATLRRATGLLVEWGMVVKAQGKGTYATGDPRPQR